MVVVKSWRVGNESLHLDRCYSTLRLTDGDGTLLWTARCIIGCDTMVRLQNGILIGRLRAFRWPFRIQYELRSIDGVVIVSDADVRSLRYAAL
jgi:hypothetical protein